MALLIITSFTADIAFTFLLAPAITSQSWYSTLNAYVQFPSNEIVTSLLSAIISGVAAIIGILLAISLVVLELAANRYPYRMVRFLVEEKVGAYVIDFLIIALLFSMWALFLLQRGTIIPVVSVFVALLLASLSIVFVFVYRNYSLYFFRPQQGFQAVSLETKRSIYTVFEKGRKLGTSVMSHLQKRVQESIQVMTDFMEVLSSKNDPDSSYGSITLSSVLSLYITGKRFIDTQSGWFPSVNVPVSDENDMISIELSQPFEELALGERTVPKPNTEWLERQILHSLRTAQVKAVGKDDKLCITFSIYGYKDIIENCYGHQEFHILDLALNELRDFAIQISTIDCPEAMSGFYNIMLLLTEKSIQGLDLPKLRDVLGKLSWYSDEEVLSYRLPKIFTEELLSYRRRIETEIIVEEKILTPMQWIEKEIMEKISRIDQELSQKYYSETFKTLSKMFTKVHSKMVQSEIRNVLVAELLSLRRAIVLNKNELALENIDNVMKHALKAYGDLKGKRDLRYDVFKELKLGCLNSLKCREVKSFCKFFDTLVLVSLEELKEDEDRFPQEALESLMVIASLAFLDAEFHQEKQVFDTVADKLCKYFDISKLTKLFDTLLTRYDPKLTLKYHHWFKDIFLKMSGLPMVAKESPPSRIPDVVYDHPSDFIQRSYMIGIQECAKSMVERLKEKVKPT